ncbi:nucleoside deaminase [Desulfococcaceae bacterium HSG9]|nr:nucleoside deaminase [Desulfococcaceae bacterium HSG9]
MNNAYFMRKALAQAQKALADGEFPVGCVIADPKGILTIGSRQNSSASTVNEIDHAEIVALRHLTMLKHKPDASDITLFCTMEPCLMCFGAILLAGIRKIVYAYEDVMGGGLKCDLQTLTPLYRNRPLEITANVLRQESLTLFKTFFENQHNGYWRGSLLAEYTLNLKLEM